MFVLHDSNTLKYFINKIWGKQGAVEKSVVKSQYLSFSVAVLTLPCHLWLLPLLLPVSILLPGAQRFLHCIYSLALPAFPSHQGCIEEEWKLSLINSSYTRDTLVLICGNVAPYKAISKQPVSSFQGRPVDFPPSKLKTGCGEQVCYVLDCLAEESLKHTGFSWKRYSTLLSILPCFPAIRCKLYWQNKTQE